MQQKIFGAFGPPLEHFIGPALVLRFGGGETAAAIGPEILDGLTIRFRRFLAARPGPEDEFYLPLAVGAAVAEGDAKVVSSQAHRLKSVSRQVGAIELADQLLELLHIEHEATVSQLVEASGLRQPQVSKHLKVLTAAALVSAYRNDVQLAAAERAIRGR